MPILKILKHLSSYYTNIKAMLYNIKGIYYAICTKIYVSVKLSTHRAKVIELELIILILRLFIFTTLRNLI